LALIKLSFRYTNTIKINEIWNEILFIYSSFKSSTNLHECREWSASCSWVQTICPGALKIKLSLRRVVLPSTSDLSTESVQSVYNSLFLGLSAIFRRWHVSFIALASVVVVVVVAIDVLPNDHIQAFIVARIRLPWPMHKSVIECEPELESESDRERFQESQCKAKK